MWSCAERCSGGNCRKHMNKKTFKWVKKKKKVMKEVCRGRQGGGGCICVRAGANEVRDGAGSSRRRCYCHSQHPPGPRALRHGAGTNYACLNVCHTHAHTYKHKVKCNLCVHYTHTHTHCTRHSVTFKLSHQEMFKCQLLQSVTVTFLKIIQ